MSRFFNVLKQNYIPCLRLYFTINYPFLYPYNSIMSESGLKSLFVAKLLVVENRPFYTELMNYIP